MSEPNTTPTPPENPPQSFSLLLQGKPKSGKTTLACQFPGPKVYDLDNNMGGTIRWLKRMKLPYEHIRYFVPDMMLKDGMWQERPYQERYRALADEVKKDSADATIRTMIFDGLTKLDAYIIGEIGRQKPNIGEKNPKPRREGQMSLEDWNDHLFLVQNFITKVQASSRMTIFTAHEEISDREDMPGILVSIRGKKAQSSVPGMFTDVWRCEASQKIVVGSADQKTEWSVRTAATNNCALGCTLGLPSSFKVDWPTIKTAIEEGFGVKL